MIWIITYDISVIDKEGRRRARKVRKMCNEYGDRIQKSVYAIQASDIGITDLIDKLTALIRKDRDKIMVFRAKERSINETICMDKMLSLDRYVI